MVGLIGEAAVLYSKWTVEAYPLWPNIMSLSLLATYFTLWCRELRHANEVIRSESGANKAL